MTNFKADHILLRVKNFDETSKWYREKLGARFITEWTDNGLRYAYYEIGGFKIEIVGGGNPKPFDQPNEVQDHISDEGYRHLCFLVNDIHKVTKELQEKDVKFLREPFQYPKLNCYLAFFKDNNGNVIELSQPLKIITEDIPYEIDGKKYKKYVAYDVGITDKRPGVMIVHAFYGLGEHERKRAKMIAELGYFAMAIDLYGIEATDSEEAQENIIKKGKDEYYKSLYKELFPENDRDLLRDRVKAGLAELEGRPEVDKNKIAAIGYCMGGSAVLELARSSVDIKGVVSFHGGLNTPSKDANKIKCRIQIHNGASDPYIDYKQVFEFEKEMKETKVDYVLTQYNGAVHSFTDFTLKNEEENAKYNKEADERSWNAMVKFLEEVFSS